MHGRSISRDIPLSRDLKNVNQYAPMETARYLMERPEYASEARAYVPRLIRWVEETLAGRLPKEEGIQSGHQTISEQIGYMYKMGSHTSRYASVNAMWSSLSGDAAAREKAFRSFNWVTYLCLENGLVYVGPVEPSVWFSDGYGDYIRHFMAGMAAVPEWAESDRSHLVGSSSIVKTISYAGGRIAYTTFGKDSTETLVMAAAPRGVLAGGQPLASGAWSYDSRTKVLRVHHTASGEVQVLAD